MAPPPPVAPLRSLSSSPCSLKVLLLLCSFLLATVSEGSSVAKLRFARRSGEFKILQVADMHYANGATTPCENVLPAEQRGCSDLNTTAFLRRLILAEKPNLIVFTGKSSLSLSLSLSFFLFSANSMASLSGNAAGAGDNIFGFDANDSARSMEAAFAPAVAAGIPWAAVLGNHDQEGNLGRRGLMQHIAGMPAALSRVNPRGLSFPIDGFGNYHLSVAGAAGSAMANQSILNLYFLDSGDYSSSDFSVYDWIKPSQLLWFQQSSAKLRREHGGPAPAMAFFHIPLPEFGSFGPGNSTGVRQEGISSAAVNSGLFAAMVAAGDVKAAFVGHDHINDFCGELAGVNLCYGGGFGYHAYGKAGWPRRARVVAVSLEKTSAAGWGGVKTIRTWRRLDDRSLSTIDSQLLWTKI
ncbi:unnamed protein product [Spirodela intermedia]|uniref:Calcineurin-like phosphoesterase domain-containing protein n=1 Tax=Spirodela intermedia TaxID=51605 RepID=A0A7I8LM05_SPIIN|nr:unnamed protein product [Spirodela intermedia]